MPSDIPPANVSQNQAITFKCAACGLTLVVPHHQAGVSGPCPGCGARIDSPPSHRLPLSKPNASFQGSKQALKPRKKGRILADMTVDQKHLEQTDSAQTLKILALAILVVCLCLAATWFLNG